jgi:hypothetical protein
MSDIFIRNIVGQNAYAVPATDAALAAATAGLDALINPIANLNYLRATAWVETASGAAAARTLSCLIEQFDYNAEECPDAAEVVTLTAAIEAALVADADITSVGSQQVNIYGVGAYFLWSRNVGGYLYPDTTTDDVAVGGNTAPAPYGMWFNSGDLVLGGSAMTGTEALRVIGTSYLEGFVGVNVAPSAATGLEVVTSSTGAAVLGVRSTLDSTDDITTAWYGFHSDGTVNAGDTVTTYYGFATGVTAITGDIDFLYHFYVDTATGMVNAYGLYIEDQVPTGNEWSIYQTGSDDHNYFAGSVGVGDATPSYPLDVAGDINVQTGNAYYHTGTQVFDARQTGWAALTGTADRTTFVTDTVILSELAERVKALIDDFISHGLLGA